MSLRERLFGRNEQPNDCDKPCAQAFHCDHKKERTPVPDYDCDDPDCDETHVEIACPKCGRLFGWAQ
jgi:hypothetical protein